jgi:GNAT superfamily N-acetyltransferase
VDHSDAQIRIVSSSKEVERYVYAVCEAADEESAALGFLPHAAYTDAAEQEKLLVAVSTRGERTEYAGHLLFGLVFPHARIFQTYVRAEFRLHGTGRKLVESLVSRAEKLQFLSIKASVASDLDANVFWERLGFHLIRTRPGKADREINVRIRELATPNLLDVMGTRPAAEDVDLKFLDRLSGPAPVYAIDLNVLFDVTKQRARAPEVGRIIRASFNNLVRLAATEELIRELERTSDPNSSDPLLQLARNLPILSSPPTSQLNGTKSALAPLVFPDRHRLNILTSQDQSDLTHLATAIHNKVAGFITSESAILRSRAPLRARFGLDVVGVIEFAAMVEGSDARELLDVQVTSLGTTIGTKDILQADDTDLQSLFSRVQPPIQMVTHALKSELGIPKGRLLVHYDGYPIALGCWEIASALRPHVQAWLFTDEDYASIEPAVEFLLDSIARQSISGTTTLVSLTLPPGHVATTRIALGYGFVPNSDASNRPAGLRKLCVGRAINSRTWDAFVSEAAKTAGLGLPTHIPKFSAGDQPISLRNANEATLKIPLTTLETLLSPVLFLLPGRPGVLVPIRRRYVNDLLGGCPQMSFLCPPEARLLHERVYFSSPRNEKKLTPGTPILFYESGQDGGRACVIAVARVLRSERVLKSALQPKVVRRGVLGSENIQRLTSTPTVAATSFDNIISFRRAVPLPYLRQIGLVHFRTAQSLSHDQLSAILEEGTT